MAHCNRTGIVGEIFTTRQLVLPIFCAFVVCMSQFVLYLQRMIFYSKLKFYSHIDIVLLVKGVFYHTLKNGRLLSEHHNIYIRIKLWFKTELQDVFSGLRLGSHFVVPSLGVTIKVISNSKFFQVDVSRIASFCI